MFLGHREQEQIAQPTRRAFLLGAGATAAAIGSGDFVIGKYSHLSKLLAGPSPAQGPKLDADTYDFDAEIKEARSFIKEQYGIELHVGLGADAEKQKLVGKPATIEQYRTSMRLLIRDLMKYPPAMLKRMSQKNGFEVRIVEGLASKGEVTAFEDTKAGESVTLAGLEVEGREILLDTTSQEDFQEEAIHHELNHGFSMNFEDQAARDAKWTGFHSKITEEPYRRISKDSAANTAPRQRYFLIPYAGSAPIEDEAICAEWMMTPHLHYLFAQRWYNETDQDVKAILAAKYLETIANYDTWSGGKMNRAYFDNIYQEGLRKYQALHGK